ncbi:hypothetical protein SNEBB_002182 [Seison nebaliae]|nr:hypothetical protein SNEBB_002182 [Seison nebaliae]
MSDLQSINSLTIDDFQLQRTLGSGTYGIVTKCIYKNEYDIPYAMKRLNREGLSSSSKDMIVNEIEILKTIKHDNVVNLINFFWNKKHIYLLLEYCSGGDLACFIAKNFRLTEKLTQNFMKQIASATGYMFEHAIGHYDLKPQNILIVSKTQPPTLKIADFGFGRFLQRKPTETEIKGSPLYMAPEILEGQPYSCQVDLWAIGIIMYECLFGRPPFNSRHIDELVLEITDKTQWRVEIPKSIILSRDCRNLLENLLVKDVKKRISFQKFFIHPFIELPSVATEESYEKGIALIRKAIEHDTMGNYSHAFKYYINGLEYMIPSLKKCESNSRKIILTKKINEYTTRAEKLKEFNNASTKTETKKNIPIKNKNSDFIITNNNNNNNNNKNNYSPTNVNNYRNIPIGRKNENNNEKDSILIDTNNMYHSTNRKIGAASPNILNSVSNFFTNFNKRKSLPGSSHNDETERQLSHLMNQIKICHESAQRLLVSGIDFEIHTKLRIFCKLTEMNDSSIQWSTSKLRSRLKDIDNYGELLLHFKYEENVYELNNFLSNLDRLLNEVNRHLLILTKNKI